MCVLLYKHVSYIWQNKFDRWKVSLPNLSAVLVGSMCSLYINELFEGLQEPVEQPFPVLKSTQIFVFVQGQNPACIETVATSFLIQHFNSILVCPIIWAINVMAYMWWSVAWLWLVHGVTCLIVWPASVIHLMGWCASLYVVLCYHLPHLPCWFCIIVISVHEVTSFMVLLVL